MSASEWLSSQAVIYDQLLLLKVVSSILSFLVYSFPTGTDYGIIKSETHFIFRGSSGKPHMSGAISDLVTCHLQYAELWSINPSRMDGIK